MIEKYPYEAFMMLIGLWSFVAGGFLTYNPIAAFIISDVVITAVSIFHLVRLYTRK